MQQPTASTAINAQQPHEVPEPCDIYERFSETYSIDPHQFERSNVKRGLRNSDGTGVVAGITKISNVHGYVVNEGDQEPCEGRLTLRGYSINDLVEGTAGKGRFGYEELVYLLFSGHLPTRQDLAALTSLLDYERDLPRGFVNDHILTSPSEDVMNMLSRCVLHLYSTDPTPNDTGFKHEVDTALSLISRMPRIAVLSYYSIQQCYHGGDMVWHGPRAGLSTAETILDALRPDHAYSDDEAHMLDVMLMLQAEHGGGNNSTFTTRVMSSADTDPYSVYAAAICSLKGKKHGGANHQVRAMQADIKQHVSNWEDDDEVADYLAKIVSKQAYDKSGLVYGMGHAVYTLSDPRAVICKKYAKKLAEGTEFEAEYRLLESIERLAPEVILRERGTKKDMCANIDMYSGFVYSMMGIPEDLYTPLFACARMAGWAAHRFEEIVAGKRIIRPAYKSTRSGSRPYTPISER